MFRSSFSPNVFQPAFASQPASGSFSPSDIAGLRLWLAADSIVGLNNGDQITSWLDQSAAGNNASNLGFSVTYQTNAVNGKPSAKNPNFATLGSNSVGLGISGNGGRSLFLVAKMNVSADVVFDGAWIDSANSRAWGVGITKVYHWGAGFDVTYSSPFSTGSWVLMEYTYDGTHINTWQNGSQLSNNLSISGGALNSANLGWALFGWENGDRTSAGEIAEVVVYNSAVSDANRVLLETYLNTKYALF